VGIQARLVLHAHAGHLTSVAFSPDGRTRASADTHGTVIRWDTRTGEQPGRWQLPSGVHKVAFSPDGRYLATANANGTVKIVQLPQQPRAAAFNEAKRWTGPSSA
jgi:WD40 repeat protein